MATVTVDLQEGFTDDEVLVRVGAEPAWHGTKVTTRNQIGFAATVEMSVREGPVTVAIALPRRGISGSVVVDARGEAFVGVSLQAGGSLGIRTSEEPFRYL